MMDTTQALKDAENALRDFIALMLSSKHGLNWIDSCGVTSERLKKWEERRQVEEKRQKGGNVDERLIYYADFYDLATILEKHWSATFADVFGDLKSFKVLWAELEKFRDSDAHRRELLPHQKHLALGISGEIRTRIIRYRSKMETSEDYFPRIESVRDNLGNIWTPGTNSFITLHTGKILRPADVLEFVITASDPMGAALKYSIAKFPERPKWGNSNTISYTVKETDVAKNFILGIFIISSRDYHANPIGDDQVEFIYTVLPSPAA